MKHHFYNYRGHASTFDDVLSVPGREGITPGVVRDIPQIRAITNILGQCSGRTDLSKEQVRDIFAGAERQLAVIEATYDLAERIVRDARAGLGLVPDKPDGPAKSDEKGG